MSMSAICASLQGLCDGCEGNYEFCLSFNDGICAASQIDDAIKQGGTNEKSD